MHRPAFDWDGGNEGHIAERGYVRQDIEDALADPYRLIGRSYDTSTERRRATLCATGTRVLIVITTLRQGKIHVVTAYPASRRERARYWEHREGE